MELKNQTAKKTITPRLIIHGGAGNILPSNLPPKEYTAFHHTLLHILSLVNAHLHDPPSSSFSDPPPKSKPKPMAHSLRIATLAVTHLENSPLFNSGRGAVYTRAGTHEMEASVMVSRGYKKRGVGVMGLRSVKNPVLLAREMLIRGEEDLEGGNGEHRGPMMTGELARRERVKMEGQKHELTSAQGHSQLYGASAEELARSWGLETRPPSYFFVQKRWDEHIAGLEREKSGKGSGSATWDAEEYVSQGTCGAVCLDAEGIVAVATSTGGMTNKLSGRIGDTPTLGAGFWGEEWEIWEDRVRSDSESESAGAGMPQIEILGALKGVLADCIPGIGGFRYRFLDGEMEQQTEKRKTKVRVRKSTAISGTGNGDSFLRLSAVRTASAIARYSPSMSLATGMAQITGRGGELQKSAEDRWRKTGEGEGGMIGIECVVEFDEDGEMVGTKSEIIADMNCGGMFRAWVTGEGKVCCRIWRKGEVDGLEGYEDEGRKYGAGEWIGWREGVVLGDGAGES